jgi:hypothetical protein
MGVPLNAECAEYGTGPVGTVSDGCGDTVEYVGLAVLTVTAVAATCVRPHAFASVVLFCTSVFHLVWGEGTIETSRHVETWNHVAVLIAFNTREVTVPVTTSTLCFFASGSRISAAYALLAWALIPTVSYLPTVYFTVFDSLGVLLGAVLYLNGHTADGPA